MPLKKVMNSSAKPCATICRAPTNKRPCGHVLPQNAHIFAERFSKTKFLATVPQVQWSGQNQTSGMVMTPGGTYLGYIEKYADGAWGIEPGRRLRKQSLTLLNLWLIQRHYLVNRLTRQVTVTFNGESKRLRILRRRLSFHCLLGIRTWRIFRMSSQSPISELEFGTSSILTRGLKSRLNFQMTNTKISHQFLKAQSQRSLRIGSRSPER